MEMLNMKNLKKVHLIPIPRFLKSFLFVAVAGLIVSCGDGKQTSVMDATFEGEGDDLERVKQEMVMPPLVPVHDQVAKGGPKIVEVTLTIEEKKIEVAPGDSVWALTFTGPVPAPLIVVHQDDFVELTLKTPATNSMMHNIDFHAATGHMGGGDISEVNPGEEVVFRFRATRAGAF